VSLRVVRRARERRAGWEDALGSRKDAEAETERSEAEGGEEAMSDPVWLVLVVVVLLILIVPARMAADSIYWDATKRVFRTWRRMWPNAKRR
jgi:hypothetical protein